MPSRSNWRSLLAIFVATLFAGALGTAGALESSGQEMPAVQSEAATARDALKSLAAPVAARAAAGHCWCEATCRGPNGQTFSRNNHGNAPSGYTQGLNAERIRCQNTCNQWLNADIGNWASEENVCGSLSCEGTSHVGSEPRNRWRAIGGAHQRTCCPAASNGQGCHPGSSQDLISVFRIVQTTDINDPYLLIYTPSQNSSYDAMLQVYTTLLEFHRLNLNHIWAGHSLEEQTSSGSWNQLAWGAVQYLPNGSGGNAGAGFFTVPISEGKTYRVWRWLFLKDVNDQDIEPYNDPSCTHIGFRIVLTVTPIQGLSAATHPGPAMATISIDGQPDRTVFVQMETPLERSRRRQHAQAPTVFERPQDLRSDGRRGRAQGGAARR